MKLIKRHFGLPIRRAGGRSCLLGMLATAVAWTIVAALAETPAAADTMTLLPTQFNTLFTGNNESDGSGYHMFVAGGHEALIQFNFNSIPPGAVIGSATLTMYMDRSTGSGTATINMNRVTTPWGMGTSGTAGTDNGFAGGGGSGFTPTTGDATWNYSIYNTTQWSNSGGDYAALASASGTVGNEIASVSLPPLATVWQGSGLVSDIQAFVNNTETNDGWIFTDFNVSDGARRFMSSDNEYNGVTDSPDYRPVLVVTYTVPEPATLALVASAVGCLGVFHVVCRWRSPRGVRLAFPAFPR